jgi:hypothetical protein
LVFEALGELQRYKIGTEAMRMGGVIPYSYISKRLTGDAAFKTAKLGAPQPLNALSKNCVCAAKLTAYLNKVCRRNLA